MQIHRVKGPDAATQSTISTNMPSDKERAKIREKKHVRTTIIYRNNVPSVHVTNVEYAQKMFYGLFCQPRTLNQ